MIGDPAPPLIAPGDPIRAAYLNALRDSGRNSPMVVVGGGLRSQAWDGVVAIWSEEHGGLVRTHPAEITDAPPAGVPQPRDMVFYSAATIGAPHIAVELEKATYSNAPVREDQPEPKPRIVPAQVGELCMIIIRPDPESEGEMMVELQVYSEGLQYGPCDDEGGA